MLLEIFEFEKETEKLNELLLIEPEEQIDEDFLSKLEKDAENCLSDVILRRNISNNSVYKENIFASEIKAENSRFRRKTRKTSSKDLLVRKMSSKEFLKDTNSETGVNISIPYGNENSNFSTNLNRRTSTTSITKNNFTHPPKQIKYKNHTPPKSKNETSQIKMSALNKKKVPAIDSYQVKLLLKDFINLDDPEQQIDMNNEESNQNLTIYSENFYQNVYNKYNGLSESLANKRKHVCLKLLNILKLLVSLIR